VRHSVYLLLNYLAMLSVAKHIASNGWMMKDLLWLIPLHYVHTHKPIIIRQTQQRFGFSTLKFGTDRLSVNVGKKLALLAAK
jgi:hypothetical protein